MRVGLISGDFERRAVVVGTFRIPFENSREGVVVRRQVLDERPRLVAVLAVFGMPMIVPLM